jgi:hypothetical protein
MVVLIISLGLAVSYPSIARGTSAFHLRATGRDVMNTLRFAREKSITEQMNMIIVADREKQLVTLSDALGGNARSYALPDDVRIKQLYLAGKEVLDGPLAIRFLPNGSSESVEIVLESRTGAVVRVVSDPLNGGARVITGAEERP